MKTLILAGGKGTRLWPLSRELMPKQFIRIFNDTSLFQKTVERALLFSKPKEIFVVTNKEYRFRVFDELRDMGIEIPKENVLLEPIGKNTLPAIYWGLKTIHENFGKSKVAVLPSDHLIDVNEKYIKAFRTAKANPEVEFKQSFNCWWPCKGSVIVKEFHAAMHHRINQGLSYSDRGIVNLFNCQRS